VLVLRFKQDRTYLMSEAVETELATLAGWLGLQHEIVIGGI